MIAVVRLDGDDIPGHWRLVLRGVVIGAAARDGLVTRMRDMLRMTGAGELADQRQRRRSQPRRQDDGHDQRTEHTGIIRTGRSGVGPGAMLAA